MPRKSAASLSVVRVDGRPKPLRPGEHLTAEQAAIFVDLVRSVPADHFRPGDTPLLEDYACSIALSRQAHAMLQAEGPVIAGRANPWLTVAEKSGRSIVALSARLRLAPQSRADARSVARQAGPAPSPYASMEND